MKLENTITISIAFTLFYIGMGAPVENLENDTLLDDHYNYNDYVYPDSSCTEIV